MKKGVVIKCFKTLKKQYFYDRFTNSVIPISGEEYKILQKYQNGKLDILKEEALEKYINSGLLKQSIIEKIEHPETPNLQYLTNHRMTQLILQVTQQCNLRCSYCAYSGNYYNREHTSQRMDVGLAKEAIKFFFRHSDETEKLAISFYGGEPLLEFSLIKQCVEYCKEHSGDKKIDYFMTTNGTLLKEEIVDFLVVNNFKLTISLDGDKEEHDANRKYSNGEGTFDIVINNLREIKSRHKDFYKKILFNTVINSKADLKRVINFFSTNELFYPGQVTLNTLAEAGLKTEDLIKTEIDFWVPNSYERLKLLLYMIGRIGIEEVNPLIQPKVKIMEALYRNLHKHITESVIMHPGGPCIPGARRLFVTTAGEFYPCERVSECTECMKIGNLENGLNYQNIKFLMNHGKLTEVECKECWNLFQCSICMGEIDPVDNKITKAKKLERCFICKSGTLHNLRELCTLIELGYKLPVEEKV